MAGKITGYTSEMCQQAMIEELEELFRDMKFNGQEGEKPLQIFKQFVPTPTDDDDDMDYYYWGIVNLICETPNTLKNEEVEALI